MLREEEPVRGLVLFDIDGTLLKAGDPAHQAAFIYALRRTYCLPATLDGMALAGMLDSQIARAALAIHGLTNGDIDARLAEMAVVMGEHYAEAVAREGRVDRLLPGAVVLAEHLRDDGFALGVLTGNVEAVARVKLAAAGVDALFPIGAYGDVAHERRHLIAAALVAARYHYDAAFTTSQTVLVGDTPRDIEAAKSGGARVVAVATGQFRVEELAAHAPDYVFANLVAMQAVLAAIHGLVEPASRSPGTG
jgi:phosphoglycolate phosphatase